MLPMLITNMVQVSILRVYSIPFICVWQVTFYTEVLFLYTENISRPKIYLYIIIVQDPQCYTQYTSTKFVGASNKNVQNVVFKCTFNLK